MNEVVSDYIIDIREYDVPYHVRVAIDKSGFNFHSLQYARNNEKLQI